MKELETMTSTAQNHKKELFRDCSTFEVNLAREDENSLIKDIDHLKEEIGSTMERLGDKLR